MALDVADPQPVGTLHCELAVDQGRRTGWRRGPAGAMHAPGGPHQALYPACGSSECPRPGAARPTPAAVNPFSGTVTVDMQAPLSLASPEGGPPDGPLLIRPALKAKISGANFNSVSTTL